jgi:GNAT superfamily N-acetyltransferase
MQGPPFRPPQSRVIVDLRQARESDFAGEYAVFFAAQEELHNRRGAPWSVPPYDASSKWAQVHRHLLEHDRERCFVAVDDGCVVGYTAAWARKDWWFFSALFIAPEYQGRGLGRGLCELAWAGDYAHRITITEAIQPISTAIYAKRGLLPVTPMLCFAGKPQIDASAVTLERTLPTAESLRLIDLAAYGFDRRVDHEFWSRTSSAPAVLWLRNGEPCAYSYRAGFRGLGPIAGVDGTSAAQALRAELANTIEETRIDIPGTATALVEVALEAGLRMRDPGLLLLQPPHLLPTAYAIHSYFLL